MKFEKNRTGILKKTIQINKVDNVAVALADLSKNTPISINGYKITLMENIKAFHKIALTDLKKGDQVIKYGATIGTMKRDVCAGSWIHVHNLRTNLSGKNKYHYNPVKAMVEKSQSSVTFKGYKRPNGKVAVRNDIWILPLVGCVNNLASKLAQEFTQRNKNIGIDGCYAFPHPFGCSQLGDDFKRTQYILSGLAKNPNAGAVLFVGLGCEDNTWDSFLKTYNPGDADVFDYLIAQEVKDEIDAGLTKLEKLHKTISTFNRTENDLSNLCIGLKCGGSDALSGITANPLVGAISDKIVSFGGTCIMTEVPEMFGAETILFDRSLNKDVFLQSVEMINSFKDYYISFNQPIYENPSPGNRDGGITTLEEKSLGCTQKSGSSPVVDILTYGEQPTKPGLNLLYGPGNDQVSVTNLVASGAQLLLFTTGRGNPYGGPVPTLKISSNTNLARKKENWIDFDAGRLLEGEAIEQVSDQLLELILKVSSGDKLTNSEIHNYREISIFKDGVVV